MPRRIRKASIEFISLVPRGANKLRSIYKSDGSCEVATISKLNDNGELTAVVYPAEHRDSQGDIADAAVVKDMARGFIAKGAKIDIRHDGKPVGPDKAYVAESFIVQKGDERFEGWKDNDGNDVDLTDSWATVIQLEDPELREKYRSGEWNGVSMGGTAIVEQEKSTGIEELVDALTKALKPAQTQPSSNEDDMTPEQFEKLQKSMTDGFAALGASLNTAIEKIAQPKTEAPAPKAGDDEGEDKEPVFKGDYTNETAVRKHAIQVQLYRLKKETDFGDTDSVEAYLEESAELRKELETLKGSKASKVRKAGNSTGGSRGGDELIDIPELGMFGLKKADRDALADSVTYADEVNKSNSRTAQEV